MGGINAVQQVILAIDVCLEKGLPAPALALVYSGIDIMASLGLPEEQHEVAREDFIRWVERYLLPGSGIECTALDLYSARCGTLHSMTADSRAVRRGAAKRLLYAWGNSMAADLQRMADLVDPSVIAVQVEALVKAFRSGIDAFAVEVDRDASLRRSVDGRVRRIFESTQLEGQSRTSLDG